MKKIIKVIYLNLPIIARGLMYLGIIIISIIEINYSTVFITLLCGWFDFKNHNAQLLLDSIDEMLVSINKEIKSKIQELRRKEMEESKDCLAKSKDEQLDLLNTKLK